MAEKNQTKKKHVMTPRAVPETLRQRVAHQIVMNLGYETTCSRTLRSCGIDHRDVTSILTRAGVLPIGSTLPVGKYNFGMTITDFLDLVEWEYDVKPKEDMDSIGEV